MSTVCIIIPARYQSTRLPGKPLKKILGVPMIERVARTAGAVSRRNENCSYLVATDHPEIEAFCAGKGIPVVMTSEHCKNGTVRCWEAVSGIEVAADFIVNLQGDNPLCPPHLIQSLIREWRKDASGARKVADVYTPAVHLPWAEYARLLKQKEATPYSGTTVEVSRSGRALSFSKSVIPAIRDVEKARRELPMSPVRRHVGLYAYTRRALERYCTFESEGLLSDYEKNYIEGLEQMRFLYNDLTVRVIDVDYRGRPTTSGVDSPEDVKRVEEILTSHGELDLENID